MQSTYLSTATVESLIHEGLIKQKSANVVSYFYPSRRAEFEIQD